MTLRNHSLKVGLIQEPDAASPPPDDAKVPGDVDQKPTLLSIGDVTRLNGWIHAKAGPI